MHRHTREHTREALKRRKAQIIRRNMEKLHKEKNVYTSWRNPDGKWFPLNPHAVGYEASHRGLCSCPVCGNLRTTLGEITIQEMKDREYTKQQLEELGDDETEDTA